MILSPFSFNLIHLVSLCSLIQRTHIKNKDIIDPSVQIEKKCDLLNNVKITKLFVIKFGITNSFVLYLHELALSIFYYGENNEETH